MGEKPFMTSKAFYTKTINHYLSKEIIIRDFYFRALIPTLSTLKSFTINLIKLDVTQTILFERILSKNT